MLPRRWATCVDESRTRAQFIVTPFREEDDDDDDEKKRPMMERACNGISYSFSCVCVYTHSIGRVIDITAGRQDMHNTDDPGGWTFPTCSTRLCVLCDFQCRARPTASYPRPQNTRVSPHHTTTIYTCWLFPYCSSRRGGGSGVGRNEQGGRVRGGC